MLFYFLKGVSALAISNSAMCGMKKKHPFKYNQLKSQKDEKLLSTSRNVERKKLLYADKCILLGVSVESSVT